MKRKYKKQRRIAVDETKHTVRSIDNNILHQKLLSKPVELQRSPKKDMTPNKHKLRGPGGMYVSGSERARLMKEGIISECKLMVQKLESDDEQSDFEGYDKSNGNPLNFGVDKELAVNKPTLALLSNISEEDEVNNNG